MEGRPADASSDQESNGGTKDATQQPTPRKKLQIIQFYNELFVPTVQEFILHTIKPAVLTPSSSSPSSSASSASSLQSRSALPSLSPLPVRSRGAADGGGDGYPNIFISTMRAHTVPPSPQQRVLSAVVGESPTKRLQEMNDMLVGSSSSSFSGHASARKSAAAVAKGRGTGGLGSTKALFRASGEQSASDTTEAGAGVGLGGGGGVVGAADGVAALLLASSHTAGSNGHSLR